MLLGKRDGQSELWATINHRVPNNRDGELVHAKQLFSIYFYFFPASILSTLSFFLIATDLTPTDRPSFQVSVSISSLQLLHSLHPR